MKPESLDTLLLDRALGELPPAVMELLEEHLTQNPDAVQQADTLTATLQLARQAVALPSETAPGPLAIGRLRHAQHVWRWRGRMRATLQLAACVGLGLTLGWYAHAPRSTPVLAQTTQPEPTAVRTNAFVLEQSSSDMGGTPVSSPDGGSRQKAVAAQAAHRFWSLAELQAEQRSRPASAFHQEGHYQLQWDSPVKMPRVVEGKL